MSGKARIEWIDIAKAIGIALVVVGHVLPADRGALSRTIVQGIFLFHMPLFFVLSGLLFSPDDPKAVFTKRVKSLLVPYAGYILLILCLDTIISLAAGRSPSVTTAKEVADLILGGSFATGKYGVIWFVTCLFFVTVVFNEFAQRVRSDSVAAYLWIAFALVLSAAFGSMPALPNPWGIFSVPAGLVAFFFGYKLRSIDINSSAIRVFVLASVMAAVAAYLFTNADFRFDMKQHIFGPPVLGIALALGLSTLLIWGCRLIDERLPLSYLAKAGEYVLPIMMLHQFVHFTLKDFGVQNVAVIAVLSFALPLVVAVAFGRWTVTRRVFLGREGGSRKLRQDSQF